MVSLFLVEAALYLEPDCLHSNSSSLSSSYRTVGNGLNFLVSLSLHLYTGDHSTPYPVGLYTDWLIMFYLSIYLLNI